MNKVPRTFCVTLKETPLRTKAFQAEAERVGLNVELFYGIMGSRMKLTPKLPNQMECPGQNIFMTDGAVGCFLSHLMLWNLLSYLPEEEFLIVEDDVLFEEGFVEKFLERCSRLPAGWEMVYVGWLPFGDNKRKVVVDEGVSILHPSATHAYMIKKSILRNICDSIQPCCSPIDLTIGLKVLPSIRHYVFTPPLVSQRSFSNSTDSVWNSLVYDWQSDHYGVKRAILKKFELADGWHSAEKDEKSVWKWSKDKFTMYLPVNIESLTLECSTPIETSVDIICGGKTDTFPLIVGNNVLKISTRHSDRLEGKMSKYFQPSEHDPNSKDTRRLGICLKKVSLNTGTSVIDIGIEDFVSVPPLSFKL